MAEVADQSPRTIAADAELPLKVLRKLWERMVGMYPGIWARDCGESPQRDDGSLTSVGDTWRRALTGVPADAVARGLNECLFRGSGSRWPPSAPTFREMCLGVPPLAQAKLDLHAGTLTGWTVLMYRFLDRHRLKLAPAELGDRMIADAHALAVRHVLGGGAIPPVPHELPPPPPVPRTPATAETVATELGKMHDALARAEAAAPTPDEEATP